MGTHESLSKNLQQKKKKKVVLVKPIKTSYMYIAWDDLFQADVKDLNWISF